MKELEKKADEIEEHGLKVSYKAPVGIPYREIDRIAREEDVDLIAMGSRGRRRVNKMLLGGMTSNVIRVSDIPILVERIDIVEELDEESYKLVCT